LAHSSAHRPPEDYRAAGLLPIGDLVICFFHKNERSLQCEISATTIPDTFAIVVTEADGTIRSHFVQGSSETQRRWDQLELDLKAAGWRGPLRPA
jgi:hypothetical protein